jgi:hypothetical protein
MAYLLRVGAETREDEEKKKSKEVEREQKKKKKKKLKKTKKTKKNSPRHRHRQIKQEMNSFRKLLERSRWRLTARLVNVSRACQTVN